MRAKRFFYVSSSILALTIAYHLGVTTARGAGGTLAGVTDGGYGSYAISTSGSVYYSHYGTQTPSAANWTLVGTVPVSGSAVAIVDAGTTSSGIDAVHAFDVNGNFYLSSDAGRTWSRRGNVFGSPTPALQETWGALKARYRAPAPTSAPAEVR